MKHKQPRRSRIWTRVADSLSYDNNRYDKFATLIKYLKYYFYSQKISDLVSLFNGISTFVGYLMPKQWYYLSYC